VKEDRIKNLILFALVVILILVVVSNLENHRSRPQPQVAVTDTTPSPSPSQNTSVVASQDVTPAIAVLPPTPSPVAVPKVAERPKPIYTANARPQPAVSQPTITISAPASYVNQPSFDCSKAQSDAEHLICSDPELAALDRQLAIVYQHALAVVRDKAAFKESTGQEWLYRERTCHDKACVMRWYVDQRTNLAQIAETGRMP
jgi:uncharacterized protein YecT (DUF1311 family)